MGNWNRWTLATIAAGLWLPTAVFAAPPGGVGTVHGGNVPAVRAVPPASVARPIAGRGFNPNLNLPGNIGYVPTTGYHGTYTNQFTPGRPLPARPGGRGGYGYGGYGYGGRGYRGGGALLWSYPLASYYYPLFDDSYGYGPDYGGGAPPDAQDPNAQNMQLMQNQIGEQLSDLSAQVADLQQARAQGAGQASPPPATSSPQASAVVNEPPVPPITLILRDGQHWQVQNYAVVDGVLWDFSKPVTRKISVDSIDLTASAKATEAQGVPFPELSNRSNAE
jgi:hypothetical protein